MTAKQGRRYEKGDAMTVVVIVLVVALLGALGFIAWQNFDKKDDTKANDTTSQQTKHEDVAKENVIELSMWGVEMIDLHPVYKLTAVKVQEGEYEGYEIRVPESVLFNDEKRSGTQMVGRIGRVKADLPASEAFIGEDDSKTARQVVEEYAKNADSRLSAVIVGDYLYKYDIRHSYAYEGDTDVEKMADKKLELIATETAPTMLKTLRAAR